jgi:ABC-type transporter Mla subunit MlaD
MTEVRRNMLVGLFMIAGLAMLGTLMVIFGETPSWLGGAEYELRITVREDLRGIDDGTPIFLNGIKVGRVMELQFLNSQAPEEGVAIIGRIEQEYQVPGGAMATCYGPLLGVGRGRIELTAVSSDLPPLKSGQTITGWMGSPWDGAIPDTMLTSLETTVVNVGKFAEQLTPVANDLHVLLQKRTIDEVDAPAAGQSPTPANLYTAIQRLDQGLKSFNEVIGDPKIKSGLVEGVENLNAMSADGRKTFENLRDASERLKIDVNRITDKAEAAVDNFSNQTTRLADAAMPMLDSAARTAANTRTISDGLVRGDGTLGLLLTDPRLYEVVVLSFERVVDLLDTLRRLGFHWEKQGRIGIDMPLGQVDRPVNKSN